MSNVIKIGNLTIDSFKVGSADCRVYLGDTCVYSGDTPTPSLEYIPFDTRMEQYQDKYIKRIVIGDSSTYSGGSFDMGEVGGSRLHFNTDGSTVTAYGDFVVDGVTNLTLPIDITPVNPVQLTNNNWGKTNVISFWPVEQEIYNGFSDLHIEWA